MEKTSLSKIALFFTCVLVISLSIFSQDDSKPWERLGLSLTEWKLIQDNHLPMSKVEALLKDGIGISEYFEKPWESYGMTEEKWIAKRRSGLTNYDIEQEQRAADKTIQKNEPEKEYRFQEYDVSQENSRAFVSFVVPGYVQYRSGRKKSGMVMIGVAAGSIVSCVGMSVVKKQFISLPLFVVLVPDMVWSLVDFKRNSLPVAAP